MSVTSEIANGVAVVTIDRPERKNAINGEMQIAIERIFRELQDDPAVRVVIFTGKAENFSAGADITEMGKGGIPDSLGRLRRLHYMVRAVAGLKKPVIAAVLGNCIGMAWSLVLACDLIFAAEDARFQFAFRHIGLAPDAGASFLLRNYVGVLRAKEIVFSGRFVSGTEAAALGLALAALPKDQVFAHAQEVAAGFADAPTLALSMAKRQFEALSAQTLDQALDFEAIMQPLIVQSADFKEGTASFKEKRPPKFSGA
jgi:2-(1,2-epoxy-1,2-dihydrophenyl)acetyl-CoA isomerase